MGIINSNNIKLLCKEACSSLLRAKPKVNINSLRYLATETIETSLHNQSSAKASKTSARKALQEYFSANTEKQKREAVDIIDKYLEKIAKEDFKTQSGCSYDDYLQDTKLRFWEIVDRKRKNGTFNPKLIMIEMRCHKPSSSAKPNMSDFENIENYVDKIRTSDSAIEAFENLDMLHHLESQWTTRRADMFKMYIYENKSLEEISKIYNLSTERIKQVLSNGAEIASANRQKILSDSFLENRSKNALKALNEIIKKEEIKNLTLQA